MSQLREYAGKGWHEWPSSGDVEELSLSSSPSLASGDITPNSSRPSSPPCQAVPGDDVMKLPRRDMHMFGQCPEQDDFTLAVCDRCNLVVKIEALASHVKLRHGLPLKLPGVTTPTSAISRTGSRGSSKGSSKKPSMVELKTIKSDSGISSKCSSTNSCPPPSRSKTPSPDKELTRPAVSHALAAASVADKLSVRSDLMEVDSVSQDFPAKKFENITKIKFVSKSLLSKFTAASEENRTSRSNVISIPDSDLHTGLVDMVSEVKSPVSENNRSLSTKSSEGYSKQNVSSTTSIHLSSSGTNHNPPTVTRSIILHTPAANQSLLINPPKQSPGKNRNDRTDRKPPREYHPDRNCGVWEASRNCTRSLTCKCHSVLLKRKVEGRSRPFDELLAAHKKSQAEIAAAATIQTIPVALPNKIPPTPVTLQKTPVTLHKTPVTLSTTPITLHKPPITLHRTSVSIHKTPVTLSTPSITLSTPSVTSVTISTTPATLPKTPTTLPKTPVTLLSTAVTLPSTPIAPAALISLANRVGPLPLSKPNLAFPSTPSKPAFTVYKETNESYHFTNDHPKPLAVCTFNGRRIGGMLFSDRSRLLTRKLVRVALTSSGPGMSGTRTSGVAGFHRIGPRINLFQDTPQTVAIVNGLKRPREKEPTYLLNYSIGGKRAVTGVGTSLLSGPTSPTVNLSTLQPGSSVVIPDSFKTDIQDFKGGIKFELGSQIKLTHMPSGSGLP